MSIALPAGSLDTAIPATVAEPTAYAPLPLGAEPRCLIIVPAYNEEGTIGRLIERLQRTLPEMDVLVVDDGSTDHTVRVCRAASRASRVRTISLPFNVGIGGAMQTGYRYAEEHSYDIAIQVDGDGQHRPCEVHKLVSRIA
ncbi:MAG TPA: glycosyltransferase family 2 protein, partial [Candidatus Sulfotelmatobacter sp.]|nr:glycosyltransferase family 2 protein [Candidatus Sulfotelmatobacter sp.]